jgi:hypothetical protein
MIVMRRRRKEEEPQNMVIMSPVPEEAGIVEEGIADESGDARLSESSSELASSTAIESEAESSTDRVPPKATVIVSSPLWETEDHAAVGPQ